MENKWKQADAETSYKNPQAMTEELTEEERVVIHERSDFFTHKKVGIAMGVLGAILLIVGVTPMITGTPATYFKGDLTGMPQAEKQVDPLVAIMEAGMKKETPQSENKPEEKTSTGTPELPSDLKSFGTNTSVEVNSAPEIIVPSPGSIDMHSGFVAPPSQASDPIISEVDAILSAESINKGKTLQEQNIEATQAVKVNPAPTKTPAAVNTNTGKQDLQGSAFGSNGSVATQSSTQTQSAPLHSAAGIASKTTPLSTSGANLSKSGPADTALLLLLLSLFFVGGMRYMRK